MKLRAADPVARLMIGKPGDDVEVVIVHGHDDNFNALNKKLGRDFLARNAALAEVQRNSRVFHQSFGPLISLGVASGRRRALVVAFDMVFVSSCSIAARIAR